MHVDCTLYKTCEECQEGLEILIPLFEHSDIGAGNMSATFSWSQAGPQNLDFKVSGKMVTPADPNVTTSPENECLFPNPWMNITHHPTCKASFLMKDDDNKKKQNPETLTFQKDRVFVYLITVHVVTV